MVVMLWANEVFDRDHPDTYTRVVENGVQEMLACLCDEGEEILL